VLANADICLNLRGEPCRTEIIVSIFPTFEFFINSLENKRKYKFERIPGIVWRETVSIFLTNFPSSSWELIQPKNGSSKRLPGITA